VEKTNVLHLGLLFDRLKRESAIIAEALAEKRLEVVVSRYSLQNGQVEVLDATW